MEQIHQENFLCDLLNEIVCFRDRVSGGRITEIDDSLEEVEKFLKERHGSSVYINKSPAEDGRGYNLELRIEKQEFQVDVVIPDTHKSFHPTYFSIRKVVFKGCSFRKNVDNESLDDRMFCYEDCTFFGECTIRDSGLQGNNFKEGSHLSVCLKEQDVCIEGLKVKGLTLLPVPDSGSAYSLRLKNNKIRGTLDLARFQEFSSFILVGNNIEVIQFSTSNFDQLPSSTIFLENKIEKASYYDTPASKENLHFLYGSWKDKMLQKHNTENARIFHAEQLRVKENKTLGDKVLIFCMKVLSNFGQSWLRPIVIFLLLNLMFLMVVYWLVHGVSFMDINSLPVDFLNLLNPTSVTKSAEDVISILKEDGVADGVGLLLSTLYLLRSVLSAILIYLAIRGAKKFQF